MTSAAQQLITAPIARKLMAAEAKKGNYFNLPTMTEIEQFYWQKKSWWSLRDIMIRKYNSMAMLEIPLGSDKDAQQDPARNNEEGEGRDDYSIDPSPFDTVTQAISMAAKMRAYANTYPTDEKHTPSILQEYGKFGNAVLDMESKKADYIPIDMSKLINTGWLIKLYPFDPQLQDKGEFPFAIETLSPLGVYPDMDIHNRVLRVCIERKLTGAQLLANYYSYQGVRELFECEPGFGKNDMPPADSTVYRDWSQKKNNLLTTEFKFVRYYDNVATAIMLDGSGVSDNACKYNAALRSLKDRSTGRNGSKAKHLTGIYTKSGDRDDPFYGVAAHNLGRVPMSIEFCWPEVRDSTTYDDEYESGRLGGLPLMWSGFSTWKEICRNFSMLNNILYKTATAPIVTNIKNFSMDSDVIEAEADEKAVYMQPPQVQQQIQQIMGRLDNLWQKGTFAGAVSGTDSEQSARGTDMVINAGGVRFDHVVRKIGRAWTGTLEGITDILRERGGDEPIKFWGFGKKYDGQPYAGKFKAALNGATSPGVLCELKRIDAMTDPNRIALFKTVDGIIPAVEAYDKILEVPNPQGMFDAMRQEKIDTEQTNMAPDVEIGALEKQLKVAQKKADLQWKLQEIADKNQHESDLRQAALDLSQLPEEEVIARQKAHIQMEMQKSSQPQGQPNTPTGGPGSGPFGMSTPTGPGTNLPLPQPSPPTMPPMGGPMNGIPLRPSPAPFSGQGSPMPMPMPMMQPRPPMPMPMPVPLPPQMLGRRVATAPGQAQQPIQTPSRFVPSGGVGAPGVVARLVGPQGLPGQPATLPHIEAANRAVAPVGPLPTVGLGKQQQGKNKRRRAGK